MMKIIEIKAREPKKEELRTKTKILLAKELLVETQLKNEITRLKYETEYNMISESLVNSIVILLQVFDKVYDKLTKTLSIEIAEGKMSYTTVIKDILHPINDRMYIQHSRFLSILYNNLKCDNDITDYIDIKKCTNVVKKNSVLYIHQITLEFLKDNFEDVYKELKESYEIISITRV